MEEWTLSVDGYGPVKFGMTKEDVLAAVPGAKIDPIGYGSSCDFVAFPGATTDPYGSPAGVIFDSMTGELVGIRALEGAMTDAGVGVGDSANAIIAAFPDAEQEWIYGGIISSWILMIGPGPNGGYLSAIFEGPESTIPTSQPADQIRIGNFSHVQAHEWCSG